MRMLIGMFFKLKEGSRTRGCKAALVKEQRRLDMRKYSFSQRVINEWNKLPNDCVNASSVNMFKNRIDISDKGGLHIDEKMFGMANGIAILLNKILSHTPRLLKSFHHLADDAEH